MIGNRTTMFILRMIQIYKDFSFIIFDCNYICNFPRTIVIYNIVVFIFYILYHVILHGISNVWLYLLGFMLQINAIPFFCIYQAIINTVWCIPWYNTIETLQSCIISIEESRTIFIKELINEHFIRIYHKFQRNVAFRIFANVGAYRLSVSSFNRKFYFT